MPGSAKQIIDAHVYQQRELTNVAKRLSIAEAISVITGAIGAQVLTIGSLAATVGLIVLGYPAASIAAVIPAILSASAQVVSASRRKKD